MPFLHSLTFSDRISNFASKGYRKFLGKFLHGGKVLITWLVVPKSDQFKNLKATYGCVQTLRIYGMLPAGRPDGNNHVW